MARRAELVTAVFHQNLVTVTARVMREILSLLGHVDTADVDRWWKTVGPQVETQVHNGWLTARDLAIQYISNHAKASGLPPDLVRPVSATWSPKATQTSLLVTGPVAFKTAIRNGAAPAQATDLMRVQLLGSSQRIASNGGRGTVYGTAREAPAIVGWRRVHNEAKDPCYWCAMLLSRGAVYKTAATAGDVESGGDAYHDHDLCTVEPLYEDEEEPESVQKLYDEWLTVTEKVKAADKVKAWRRYWENRNKQSEE